MMTRESAELLALKALGWIASDEARAGAFLGAAGCAAEDLRLRAQDPEFLGFVMDFLLGDEPALLEFCDAAGLPYDAPMQARAALPGGEVPHWT